MTITYKECVCPVCNRRIILSLDADKVKRWENGELIQNVFPELSISEREALITGTCDKCWDEMWEDTAVEDGD